MSTVLFIYLFQFVFFLTSVFFIYFKLYDIVLVLSYINMNPPRVYTCLATAPSYFLCFILLTKSQNPHFTKYIVKNGNSFWKKFPYYPRVVFN